MSDKIAFLEYEQKHGGIMDIAESHPPKGAPLQPEMGLTSLFKRVNQQHFRYDFGRMATIRVLLFDPNFGNTTDRGGCLHGHDYSHTPSLAWGYDFVPVVLAKGGGTRRAEFKSSSFCHPLQLSLQYHPYKCTERDVQCAR